MADRTSTASFDVDLETKVATRTLIAAGFVITNFRRQPRHGEFFCERNDQFGAKVRYLLVVLDADDPAEGELEFAERSARQEGRIFVAVAKAPGPNCLGWEEFLDALGGAVPSWRALSSSFSSILLTAASNILPPGFTGEAWQLFEDVVADGFEFILGHRVQRLGGHQRGQRVADMITVTPDDQLLIVDAKASGKAFDANPPNLRPMAEYVDTQRVRQRGGIAIGAAVLVAKSFEQDEQRLQEIAREFQADRRVPISFLSADIMLLMIEKLSSNSRVRNSIRWARVLCSGGPVTATIVKREFTAAVSEAVSR